MDGRETFLSAINGLVGSTVGILGRKRSRCCETFVYSCDIQNVLVRRARCIGVKSLFFPVMLREAASQAKLFQWPVWVYAHSLLVCEWFSYLGNVVLGQLSNVWTAQNCLSGVYRSLTQLVVDAESWCDWLCFAAAVAALVAVLYHNLLRGAVCNILSNCWHVSTNWS